MNELARQMLGPDEISPIPESSGRLPCNPSSRGNLRCQTLSPRFAPPQPHPAFSTRAGSARPLQPPRSSIRAASSRPELRTLYAPARHTRGKSASARRGWAAHARAALASPPRGPNLPAVRVLPKTGHAPQRTSDVQQHRRAAPPREELNDRRIPQLRRTPFPSGSAPSAAYNRQTREIEPRLPCSGCRPHANTACPGQHQPISLLDQTQSHPVRHRDLRQSPTVETDRADSKQCVDAWTQTLPGLVDEASSRQQTSRWGT